MARPKGGYYLKDGTRVPSVTTIIGRFKDAGGLVHWAWKLGMEGRDYREERDAAAAAGTLAHTMLENVLHRKDPHDGIDLAQIDESILRPAETALAAATSWMQQQHVEVAMTEVALVSERYRYGGTLDAVLQQGDKLVLADWKTSNSVYPEYICQLAAYRQLLVENGHGPIAPEAVLVRFDRETADFHVHRYTDLDDAWRAFARMRELYDLMAKLKKRAS